MRLEHDQNGDPKMAKILTPKMAKMVYPKMDQKVAPELGQNAEPRVDQTSFQEWTKPRSKSGPNLVPRKARQRRRAEFLFALYIRAPARSVFWSGFLDDLWAHFWAASGLTFGQPLGPFFGQPLGPLSGTASGPTF